MLLGHSSASNNRNWQGWCIWRMPHNGSASIDGMSVISMPNQVHRVERTRQTWCLCISPSLWELTNIHNTLSS